MANSKSNGKVFYILGLLCLLVLIHKGSAYEFRVGGSGGWSVPSDAQSYSQWAEKNRFQIGDSLLFVYSSDKDSVLQVTKDHFTNCTTENPIAKFSDGHTVFKFNQSGPHYFISGSKDKCLKNEKLVIIVLADRTSSTKSSPAPAPSSDEYPSPPSGSTDTSPSPAQQGPSADQNEPQTPPKSGASSVALGVVSLFGAFVGSSFVF